MLSISFVNDFISLLMTRKPKSMFRLLFYDTINSFFFFIFLFILSCFHRTDVSVTTNVNIESGFECDRYHSFTVTDL